MLREANLFTSPPRSTTPGWEWTTVPQGKNKPCRARQRALKTQYEFSQYGGPSLYQRFADLAESRIAEQLQETRQIERHNYWMKDFFKLLDQVDAIIEARTDAILDSRKFEGTSLEWVETPKLIEDFSEVLIGKPSEKQS
jgi:hypothetical protein